MTKHVDQYDDTEQAIFDYLSLKGKKVERTPVDKQELAEHGARVIFEIHHEMVESVGEEGVIDAMAQQIEISKLQKAIRKGK